MEDRFAAGAVGTAAGGGVEGSGFVHLNASANARLVSNITNATNFKSGRWGIRLSFMAHTTDLSNDQNLSAANSCGNLLSRFSRRLGISASKDYEKWLRNITWFLHKASCKRKARLNREHLVANNECVFFGNTQTTIAVNSSQTYLVLSSLKQICGKSQSN